MKVTKWVSVLTLALVAGSAFAEGAKVSVSVKDGEAIFRNGKGDVPACQSCHGEKGMGNDAMGTPRLTGQPWSYIVKQLTDFATDKRTDTTLGVMNGIAKNLSDQDKKNLAIFVNKLDAADEPSDIEALKADGKAVGDRYKGKELVLYGISMPNRSVSACQTCHAYNGRGSAPIYPAIGQQKFVYLVNQLTKWRDGTRTNDPMGQMRAVAKTLTDEEIQNVANYLSNAPRSTDGDPFVFKNKEVTEALQITH